MILQSNVVQKLLKTPCIRAFNLLWALLFICCDSQPASETAQAPAAVEAVVVEAETVAPNTYPQLISYAANVEAWETAFIAGPTGVRIDEIHVEEGDAVRSGQVLATMNSAQLNQARTQMELAKREVERLDTLVKIGSISGQRFDQAQSEYQNALTNYQSLVENTRLKANFSGVVTRRYFSPGEMFVPSADAPAILTIMQIQPVKVTIQVAESYYSQVSTDLNATVRTDVFADETFTGRVFRKSPVIHQNSRTFQVEIRIENKQQLLRPGMFARVSLNLGEVKGIYIPSKAIVNQPGTSNQFVFVLDNNSARRVAIETANRYQDLVRVVTGLAPGQTVVTEGMGKLREGSPVRVLNNSESQSENEGL